MAPFAKIFVRSSEITVEPSTEDISRMCLKGAVSLEAGDASHLSNRRKGVRFTYLQEPLQVLDVMLLWYRRLLSKHHFGCKPTPQGMQLARRPPYVDFFINVSAP